MASTTGDRAKVFPVIERKHGQPMQYWFDLLTESDATKYDEQMAILQEGHGFSRAHANAVVMTHRGSTTTRKYSDADAYFNTVDPVAAVTGRAIFAAIRKRVKGLELVTAWNQPMLKAESGYVFGLSVAKAHITMNPMSGTVMEAFADRLSGYKCGKKTFNVPLDWKVDATLLADIARFRLQELG